MLSGENPTQRSFLGGRGKGLERAFRPEPFEFSVTSEVMPGAERSFESFAAAAQEATLSRIFAGQHFRFDLSAGRVVGLQVADLVLDHFLTPRDDEELERD